MGFVLQIEGGIQRGNMGLGDGFMEHLPTMRPAPSLMHIGQMAVQYKGEGAFHGTFLFHYPGLDAIIYPVLLYWQTP